MISTLRILLIFLVVVLIQVFLLDLFSFRINLVAIILFLPFLNYFKDWKISDYSWFLFLILEFIKIDVVGFFSLFALILSWSSNIISKNLNPSVVRFIEFNLLFSMYYILANDFSNNFWIQLVGFNLAFILLQIKNYAYPKSDK